MKNNQNLDNNLLSSPSKVLKIIKEKTKQFNPVIICGIMANSFALIPFGHPFKLTTNLEINLQIINNLNSDLDLKNKNKVMTKVKK